MCVCECTCVTHIIPLAVVVVCGAVVPQHLVDDVTAGPPGEQQLAVLVAHVLPCTRTHARTHTHTHTVIDIIGH